MSQVETVFLDCGGTLVDSEVICSRAYVTMFREFGIHADLEEIFTRFKGAKLYEIIDIISKEQGVTMIQADAEHIYRAEVARLFDTGLEDIAGTNELLASISVSMYVASNSPVNRIQHLFGKLDMLHYLPEKLSSGYNIQRWKPDPALIFHAAKAMNMNVGNRTPVDDSNVGTQSETDAGMEVLYFCADLHNKPIVRPKATTFIHSSQLPELWKAHGWDITTQLSTLPPPTPLELACKSKQREFDMSVSHRITHHGLCSAVLGSLTGILFLVLYIFFAKEPLTLLIVIQILPLLLLMLIATGAIPVMLTDVMVVYLPGKIGSQKRYRCLAGGIGGAVITEIYCVVVVHIKDMVSLALFKNILSGESLVVRIIPALLAGVVVGRIIMYLPGLDISRPETDSLS